MRVFPIVHVELVFLGGRKVRYSSGGLLRDGDVLEGEGEAQIRER